MHLVRDVPKEKFGGGEPDRTIVSLPLTPISSVTEVDTGITILKYLDQMLACLSR